MINKDSKINHLYVKLKMRCNHDIYNKTQIENKRIDVLEDKNTYRYDILEVENRNIDYQEKEYNNNDYEKKDKEKEKEEKNELKLSQGMKFII
ncbi:hypothetical protein C1645_816831 [Glomus cerebriforme]|uniref:Uncharacterized protein n=1 Tax=Glomus cerebriforme TaxID=658196 RepID=A0A397TFW1_9GLOM|nr:hypothetical protein C1645_816831 [Glomus cerebriforme]